MYVNLIFSGNENNLLICQNLNISNTIIEMQLKNKIFFKMLSKMKFIPTGYIIICYYKFYLRLKSNIIDNKLKTSYRQDCSKRRCLNRSIFVARKLYDKIQCFRTNT